MDIYDWFPCLEIIIKELMIASNFLLCTLWYKMVTKTRDRWKSSFHHELMWVMELLCLNRLFACSCLLHYIWMHNKSSNKERLKSFQPAFGIKKGGHRSLLQIKELEGVNKVRWLPSRLHHHWLSKTLLSKRNTWLRERSAKILGSISVF